MDPGENTDRMTAVCQHAGLRDMVSFLIDIFCFRAFRAVPDKTESFEFITVGFYHIAVINVDDRLGRDPFPDSGKIR